MTTFREAMDEGTRAVQRQTEHIGTLLEKVGTLKDLYVQAGDAARALESPAEAAGKDSPPSGKGYTGPSNDPYIAGHPPPPTGFGRHTDGNDAQGRIDRIQHGDGGGGGGGGGEQNSVSFKVAPVRLFSQTGGYMVAEEWAKLHCTIMEIEIPDPAGRFLPIEQQRRIKVKAYDCRAAQQNPLAIYPFDVPSGSPFLSVGTGGGAEVSVGGGGGSAGSAGPSDPSSGGSLRTGQKSTRSDAGGDTGSPRPPYPSPLPAVVVHSKQPTAPTPGELAIVAAIASQSGAIMKALANASRENDALSMRRRKL